MKPRNKSLATQIPGNGQVPQMLRPKLLIAEKSPSGHRLVYVRLLADWAAEHGVRCALATTEAALSDSRFLLHVSDSIGPEDLHSIDARASLIDLQRVGRAVGADAVVVPDSDTFSFDRALGRRWRGGPRLRLLVMSDPRWELEGARTPRLRPILKRASLTVANWRAGQELVWLREPGFKGGTERHANDPVILGAKLHDFPPLVNDYRAKMGMSRDCFWFGVVGAMQIRKNIDLVARTLVRAAAVTGQPCGLALLGPSTSEFQPSDEKRVRDTLSASVRFVRDDRHFSNLEIGVAVASVDCVVIAYSTHAPNSTLAKAAELGVRSVVAGPPSIRRFSSTVTGVPGVDLSEDSLLSAMLASLQSAPPAPCASFGHDQFCTALLSFASRER